jgi:hypothetical protein
MNIAPPYLTTEPDGSLLHHPAALPPEKEPPVPIGQDMCGPQSRSGHCGEERISFILLRIEPLPSRL